MEKTKTTFLVLLLDLFLILFFVLAVQLTMERPGYPAERPMARTVFNRVQGATAVGAAQCGTCHEGMKTLPAHTDCETCHGPGSKHVENPGRETISFPSPDTCLSCHRKRHELLTGWSTSSHNKAGLVCFDCHSPHGDDPAVVPDGRLHNSRITDKCVSCHQEKKAQMNMPYHHPLREGVLSCTDCHNPHEDASLALVSMSERCTSCHQEQRGPWTYEHAPVAEDCTLCHTPHGSVNPGLLKVAEPFVCLRCHSMAASKHGSFPAGDFPAASIYRKCTGCHGAQHGTHQDRHLRY